MTRFARAKGSKSCNARVEEDSTSWSEFKRQIEEKKYHSTNPDTPSNTSAETFLKKYKAGTPSESSWADFGDVQENINTPKKSSKKKRKLNNTDCDEQVDREKEEKLELIDQSGNFGSPKKRSKKHKQSDDDIAEATSLRQKEDSKVKVDQSDDPTNEPPKSKKKKNRNKPRAANEFPVNKSENLEEGATCQEKLNVHQKDSTNVEGNKPQIGRAHV